MAGKSGRTLTIYLAADTKGAQREIDGFASTISRSLGPAMAAAGAAAGVLAVKLGVDAVNAASDFNETVSKSEVVFGDASRELTKFAENASTSLGLSKQAAIEAATQFGIFGKAAGLTGTELTGFSTELATLAADMASFNNADISETIQAIGAGLRGEAEPLRKFGVLLDDATLKAYALEQGLYDGTGALTQSQRVMAAYGVILQQTSDQQGDFARTSDGLANQQRILDAAAENAAITIGTALLKSVLDVNRAMGGTQGLAGTIEDTADATADLTRGVGLAAAALVGLFKNTDKSENALADWIGTVLDATDNLFPWTSSLRAGANALLGIGEAANDADAALANHQGVIRATAQRYTELANAALRANAAMAQKAVSARYTALAVEKYGESVSRNGGTLQQWLADQRRINEALSGSSSGGGGGGTAGAVDEVSKAMLRAEAATQRHIDKLGVQLDKLATAEAAWKSYADSVSGALTQGTDVRKYFEDWRAAVERGENVGTLAEYLNRQLQASVDWSTQLANIPGLAPNSPGAQALIQQLATLGAEGGPAFVDAFGAASYAELAQMLANQQSAATGTGALWANYFYGQGVRNAEEMVTAMAEQIAADEKRLRKIGKAMGDPIADGIREAIQAALREAQAATASAAASGRSASTYDAAPTYNVTVTGALDPVAVARQIEQVLRVGRLRTGRPF